MSIVLNGTEIGSEIELNNTELSEIVFNGVSVWVSIPAIYETVKNATNITEAQWLEFCNKGCIKLAISKGETSSFIGKIVTLSNSVVSNYTSWKIADFGHDNSGNTCDLIQTKGIYTTVFGTSQIYSNSTARTWLNDTYLIGFSTEVKNKLQTMSVISNDSILDDKIKLLSFDEVGFTSQNTYYPYTVREGSKYPIFKSTGSGGQPDNSRIYGSEWWLRSRSTDYSNRVYAVLYDGSIASELYSSGYSTLVPCIRFA